LSDAVSDTSPRKRVALELEELDISDIHLTTYHPSMSLVPNESFLAVIHSPDLRRELVKFFNWSVICAMMAINQELRAWAFDIIHARVTKFLGLFLGVEYLPDFFELLQDSRSAVAGAIVRCIMSVMVDYYYHINPNSMEIVVPSEYSCGVGGIPATRRWHIFLLRSGYSKMSRSNLMN